MKMNTNLMLVAAASAVIALSGCGKSEPTSVSSRLDHLIKDAQAREKLKQWCSKDSTVIAYFKGDKAVESKCGLLDVADWFLKNPDEMAQVDKPEPWPGKSLDFFQASANASIPGTWIVKSKVAVTAAQRPAWGQETKWCNAQLAWKNGTISAFGFRAQDFKDISPACAAAASVTPPAPF